MFKRICAAICAFCFLFSAAACGEKPSENTEETAPSGGYDLTAAAELRDDRYVYLTVWSWQIPGSDDAAAMAAAAKEAGFTAIDLAVLWCAFEPWQNHFDWTWLDAVMETFRQAELPVSLQPLLWTMDLKWADALTLQVTAEGDVFDYDGRGGLPSLCSEENRAIITNTLQGFFLHASRTYGANLTRWGVRLSAYGEFDDSINARLDYSAPAQEAFFDDLFSLYGDSFEEFSAFSLPVSNREQLRSLGAVAVSRACTAAWRRFREKTLTEFADLCAGVMRSADHSVPIVLHVGTFGNGMNLSGSGWTNLYAAAQTDCDILGVALTDGVDDGLLLSLASATGRELSVEVDGAWALEEERDVAAQVKLCGTWGVFALSTANFTLEQLQTFQETLKTYRSLFFTDETLNDADGETGILVLPQALILQEKSYENAYGEAYRTLSENGTRRVRCFYEAEISEEGANILHGVKLLRTGNVNPPFAVSDTFLDAFTDGFTALSDGSTTAFASWDGKPLPEDDSAKVTAWLASVLNTED